MGAVNDVTEAALRELARTRAEEDSVLSVYLDLDPAHFAIAAARASEVDSLLDGAHRDVEAGERSRSERMHLREALAHAREVLEGKHSWARGAGALALFECPPLELSRLLRLPQPVRRAWVIADAPFIAPLTQVGPPGRVCVALVDERFARVARGDASGLRETISFGDQVHGRHSKGGWSQANYQRSRDEGVEAHLRHAARVLHDVLRVAPYDRLLIACTQPLWARVLAKLHADVRARLHPERVSVDVSDASIPDLERAARSALAEEQRAHEDALLAALRQQRGRGRAAAGLPAVLDALVQRRVAALMYDADLEVGGVLCSRCGWLGADAQRCPVDGATVERRESIVEEAVQAAIAQSAEVLALRDRPELGPMGAIAATLRF